MRTVVIVGLCWLLTVLVGCGDASQAEANTADQTPPPPPKCLPEAQHSGQLPARPTQEKIVDETEPSVRLFPGNRPDGKTPWTHTKFNNSDESFQFAIVSDRTGGMRPGIFEKAIEKLNLLQPEFVMCVGDLIEGCGADANGLHKEWDTFEAIVGGLEMPFCHVPGNHDIYDEQTSVAWHERFGSTYYHFVYKDVLFLCLDSDDGMVHKISDVQEKYVQEAIKQAGDVRWTCVFIHKPLWRMMYDADQWAKIGDLLYDRPHTVFAGHCHMYMHSQHKGNDYFDLATTGGMMGGTSVKKGYLDHIVWVTMTADGPKIAILPLDGVLNKQLE